MKTYLSLLLTLTLVVLTASKISAQEQAAKSFDIIKSLEGEWKGTNPEGKPVVVSYKVVSGGSAVMETLQPEDEPGMLTVYHMDDDKLMMTHYCSAGNQPRMLAKIQENEEKKIDFIFVDGTNMKTHSEGHMQGLTFFIKDKDNIEQVWTWKQGDNEKPGTFKLTRKT